RAGEESRVEGLQADADDYLVKPFTSAELLARVATHIKMAQLRRVTAEREARLRELGEREHELRVIVDTVPGLVATLTPAGELEAANAQLLAYMGRTVEELRQWATNGTIHPEDLPRVSQTELLASGKPVEIEERLRRFDGTYRWFQVRALPL